MNLLHERWLPVRRLGGGREVIAPWQITDRFEADPIVALDWPRADFSGACLEFLIGFFTVVLAPESDDDSGDPASWMERWLQPPAPEAVRSAAEQIPGVILAHELEGEGPRFFQDLDLPEKPVENGVAALLIDSPGEQGVRNNTDLFVKRARVACLSRRAAAAALLTLQTYAPSGGRGNLTSLRGGGPLTTLVVSAHRDATGGSELIDTLWGRIWPNVPTRRALRAAASDAPDDPAAVFPWLAPTHSGEGKRGTAPGREAHPLQAFFGLPRRIRLVFEPNPEGTPCDLTGEVDPIVVRRFLSRPYGVKYEAWRHPLSPYYRTTSGDWLPVHPPSGGILYRHWPGYQEATDARKPASAPAHFREVRARPLEYEEGEHAVPFRLAAFGYEMDNAKPICWHEGTMPLFGSLLPEERKTFDAWQARAVEGAEVVAAALIGNIKKLMTRRPKELRGDTGWIGERFWRETEPRFTAHLHVLRSAVQSGGSAEPAQNAWRLAMAGHALGIFESLIIELEIEVGDPERVVLARRDLHAAIYGDKVRQKLGLPMEAKTRRKGKQQGGESIRP